jgi:hypothetical protein
MAGEGWPGCGAAAEATGSEAGMMINDDVNVEGDMLLRRMLHPLVTVF